MRASEVKKYQTLNEIAEKNGIVIFGCVTDKSIPIGELRQAFEIQEKIYNRSFTSLSVKEAEEVYDTCVSVLEPETLLLHIGEEDLEFFKENSTEFDRIYHLLLSKIKKEHKKCHIAVVSLKNYENKRAMEFGGGQWLMDMDGELWLADINHHPGGIPYMWSIYNLVPYEE